jgi:large subunit ribosomal protein L23
LTRRHQNVITFDVARDANKIEVRHAVEALFSVKVDSVRIVKVSGKIKKVGRSIGRAQDRKKAYVKLAAGQKPPALFEGV